MSEPNTGWSGSSQPPVTGYKRLAERLGERAPAYLIGAILMLAAVSTSLVLFVAMVRLIGDPTIVPDVDLRVQMAVESVVSPSTVRAMVVITALGSTPVMTLLTITLGIVLLRRRRFTSLFEMLIAIPLGTAALFAMKAFFQRARPVDALFEVRGLSFPSGHAFISVVFFGFVVHLLFRSHMHRGWIAAGTFISAILILLIGTSRVYLGVHFLTDVIGGYSSGFLWLVLSILLVQAVERRTRRGEGVTPP